MIEILTLLGLVCAWRAMRRAGAAWHASAAALADAQAATGAQVEAIEQARAEVADIQSSLAGLRWMIRRMDDGDDGRDSPPPSDARDPLADFLARRAVRADR